METMSDEKKERGINANNQDFRQFEQVNKDQQYRLAEATDANVEEFDQDFQISQCDMRLAWSTSESDQTAFAQQIGQAMERIGFVVLTNHGVDPGLYARTESNIRQFFETLPESARQPYLAQRHGSVNQGYFPIKETTIIHPDMVEGWVFCRRAFDLDEDPDYSADDYWPDARYEVAFREVVVAHEALIKPLMQGMLRYLEVDPHCYDDKLTGTNFGFRLNYYPAMDKEQLASGAGRMLGHEDVDLFTLLPASSVDGLQVLNRENGRWIRLHAPPGSIVLNTGDYMQRISNDRFPSTTHRVGRPTDPALWDQPRVSFPMAVYVWENEVLEVLPGLGKPKYPPVSALEFHTAITSKYYGDDYAVDA
jgi:isopenicillin N synthase-like dioxygenase